MPEQFENAALILRLGLLSTVIFHKNGAFQNCYSKQINLKILGLSFSVDKKHFANGAFQK